MISYYIKGYIKLKKVKKIFLDLFAFIGGFYTAFEILTLLLVQQTETFRILFEFSIVLSILFSIYYNRPKRKFKYKIKNNDIKITIVIGNLFKEKGDKIIPTNTTFDTKMEGDFISSKSIQGQYQDMYYKNNIHTLDNLIENELKDINHKILNRANSKNKQYPIGTVIKLNSSNGRYYFLATADVNKDGKPNSTFENMEISLEQLWNYILEKGHTEPIVIPLLGTGRTGLTVKRQKIIKTIIFSFIAHTNEKKISDELVICIHPNDIDKIDIIELNEYLDYMCKYHYENDANKITTGTAIEENISRKYEVMEKI